MRGVTTAREAPFFFFGFDFGAAADVQCKIGRALPMRHRPGSSGGCVMPTGGGGGREGEGGGSDEREAWCEEAAARMGE